MTVRRIVFSDSFVRDYHRLPRQVREAIDRIVELLAANPRHPSVQAKKMQPKSYGFYEARVTQNYRVTYKLEGDALVLRRAGTHDILRSP